MTTAVTEGIKVSVETEYQPYYSSPRQHHYVFTYKVTIHNTSQYSIQLLKRHWHIHDAYYPMYEVDGKGVVGQQPVLESCQKYQYVSGCNLKSGMGKMHGYYLMDRLVDGRKFKVKIPIFSMIVPFKLN